MAMTRKHYREAAEVIRGEALATSEYADLEGMIKLGRRQAARKIATGLADMFEQDNPSFDRDRFMEACGLEEVRIPSVGVLNDNEPDRL